MQALDQWIFLQVITMFSGRGGAFTMSLGPPLIHLSYLASDG
jgi:hypothetical protein